jgi:mannose-6-phosphate isomerase-like protein (cupin superfamily)
MIVFVRMAVDLEGGCRVSLLREGSPREHGTVRAFHQIGRENGAVAISLRVLQVASGRSPTLGGAACDEVLYVFEGKGMLRFDGGSQPIEPDASIYIPPGARFDILNSEPMTIVSSRCPDPGESAQMAPGGAPTRVVRLDDCKSEETGDRWYRVLVDHHVGSAQVTQFVGAIPPGRAPDHYHEYEEVLCILSGRGRMWAGDKSTPIERGSCIYLPRRHVHCVENTGDSELRLLGVFYPSGSPAVRYSGGTGS